jgi:serine/threonine-protein kinase
MFGWWVTRTNPTEQTTFLSMSVSPAERLSPSVGELRPSRVDFALTPDGRTVVFSGITGTTTQLFVRRLDRPAAVPLTGTEGATVPFTSPDGQWLAFWAAGKLKKIPIAGGPSTDICDVSMAGGPLGADWGSNDLIVFSRGHEIATVPASGGMPLAIVTADANAQGVSLTTPHWLPGGRAFLYTSRPSNDWARAEIRLQSIAGGKASLLITGAADARFVSTGHLVFVKQGTLMAVPFDVTKREVTGAAIAVIDSVMQAVNMGLSSNETGAGQYALAANGTLAFVGGGITPGPKLQLMWVDRHGVESPLREPPAYVLQPRVSPDGRRIVYFKPRTGTRESDLWVYDLMRDTSTRLTFGGDNIAPIWSPDGQQVIFGSGGGESLFRVATDGSGAPDRLTNSPWLLFASSSANNHVAVVESLPNRPPRISVVSLNGDHRPMPFLESPFRLTHPAFSPDGRWLAYVSDESGRGEVYVQAYPSPGEKHRISTDGGTSPAWTSSGRELMYATTCAGTACPASTMMAVDVDTTKDFTAGTPHSLFSGPYATWTTPTRGYDVSADGQRFMVTKIIGELVNAPAAIDIVVNWAEQLRQKERALRRQSSSDDQP